MNPGVPVIAGWVLDRAVGEPPTAVHPVALFGTAMTRLERAIHADDRRAGVRYTAAGVAVGGAAGVLARSLLGRRASTAAVSWLAMAGTMLETEALGVAAALEADDLEMARRRVGMLVGRETAGLDDGEVVRAVIETLAENTTDATVATMFWAALAGAPGAAMHRAVNTMDAMVGHRNERFGRFGWASARLDDAANWLPARLTAVAVVVARPHRAGQIVRTVWRDASRHPSPNGGVSEAAFAGALGIQLGGANDYGGVVDDRGLLGDGARPVAADIRRAVRLARHVAAATLVLLTAAGWAAARPWRSRQPR